MQASNSRILSHINVYSPLLLVQYGFDYEFVTYKWPHWLHKQTDKQRVIWAYKILFLDVLFSLDVPRMIFVDSDQVVRTDLAELYNMDLKVRVWHSVFVRIITSRVCEVCLGPDQLDQLGAALQHGCKGDCLAHCVSQAQAHDHAVSRCRVCCWPTRPSEATTRRSSLPNVTVKHSVQCFLFSGCTPACCCVVAGRAVGL
jgi:hypothetical protein